jgi:XTP/dITP diphosphohydrolase
MSAEAVLLATRSAGKLRELRPMFERAGVPVTDLAAAGISATADEDELERYATFEQNALAKARFFNKISGLPAIADDSGLEVQALGGAPGVRSRRWSDRNDLTGQLLDDANNLRLLGALLGADDRRARYVCVAAYCAGGVEWTARGETAGLVMDESRGSGGFGYDPYFYSLELGRTFGESSSEEKEQVSHRGRAFRALLSRVVAAR